MATSGGAIHTPPSGPQPSAIQTSPHLVGFDPKNVQPTQPIYLQLNDLILFVLLTNGTNVTLKVDYRWLTPQGDIKEGEFVTPPFTSGLNFTIPLYEVWLLSFVIRVTSVVPAGQWTFAQAVLARSPSLPGNNQQLGNIWQGFVPGQTANGWPGTPAKEITDGAGVIRSITGTQPAAGADISEVVPSGRRWNLLAFGANLTTSATVANRSVAFFTDDSVNLWHQTPSYLVQAASLTFRYFFATQPSLTGATPTQVALQIPIGMTLKAGFHIKSLTTSIQAGDQWSAPQYLVQEWGMWDS